MKDNLGKIAILMGGPSEEREISIKSGEAVSQVLSKNGENVVDIIIPQAERESLCALEKKAFNFLKNKNIDVAFIALHGWFGEDGTIQKILDKLKIPYTGSDFLSCKKALDKEISRKIFQDNNIPVPKYKVLNSKDKIDFDALADGRFPVVVKPSSQGSSIGLNIVDDIKRLKYAAKEAFSYCDAILIEEYLSGSELTVGILDDKVLPVIEVIVQEEFYNFKAKYQDKKTEYIVPAKISNDLEFLVKKISLSAYNSLDCKGMGRVDIKLDKLNNPKVLEINTIPGLTSKSLLPKAAESAGIDFYNMCRIILESAKHNLISTRRTIHA